MMELSGGNVAVAIIGAVASGAIGMAGWAGKKVVALSESHAALQATVNAERAETLRRFDEVIGWLKALGERLERLIEK